MSVKQISVFLENKPGCLHEMTKVLADAKIDLRGLSLAETSEFGIVRLIVDDVLGTATVLKDAGFVSSLTDVIAVEVPNVPGGLNKVLEILHGEKINIEYMYAILGNKTSETAYMIFRVNDNSKATSALNNSGIKIMEQAEISAL
ncbi:MAG: acetolactate synthase [Synergistaceae bacterium]|nr:acetolactate synthase [Synergistaceae bacterium]MBQ6737270.1 acetolactate synthase [Synergistaceae bacterium]MBQ7067923.1 acetolactate synthase [Synergistaceae bacterium]MBR0076041.1 acetolactate synthase [Synergistaceae bacterium]MBR0232766.1 acetolactate synthase [Synergistaceae bacterium]